MSILESLDFHANFYYGLICIWDMYVYLSFRQNILDKTYICLGVSIVLMKIKFSCFSCLQRNLLEPHCLVL